MSCAAHRRFASRSCARSGTILGSAAGQAPPCFAIRRSPTIALPETTGSLERPAIGAWMKERGWGA